MMTKEEDREYQHLRRLVFPNEKREAARIWRSNNRDKIKSYNQKHHRIHKGDNNARSKLYYETHREERSAQKKRYRLANLDREKQQKKEYRAANLDKTRIRMRNYVRARRASDPWFRIKLSLHSRVMMAIKRHKDTPKSCGTMELVGCQIAFLIGYLEARFEPGMTWQNYGRGGWSVDHRIPCAAFDLTQPEEQRRCFHYSNLQPMWEKENLAKKDKMPTTFQAELI